MRLYSFDLKIFEKLFLEERKFNKNSLTNMIIKSFIKKDYKNIPISDILLSILESKKIYPPLKNHFELSAMIILKKHLIKKGMSPESNKIISLDKKIDNIWLQINLFSTN